MASLPATISTTSTIATSTTSSATASNGNVIYEGQLRKKGKVNKAWKNRWCSLCVVNNVYVLEYYDSKMSRKSCGTVDLSQAYSVEVLADKWESSLEAQLPDNILINTTSKNKSKTGNCKEYCFQISTLHRTYIFAAFDPAQFFTWLNHLDRYVYGGVIKRGWLDKKGEKNKGWKKRYFVLNHYNQMKYFDRDKKRFLGTIHLNKVSSITNGRVYSDDYKFTFHLVTDKRTWILCAADLKDREEWQRAIRRSQGIEPTTILSPRTVHNMKIAHMTQLSHLKHFANDIQDMKLASGDVLHSAMAIDELQEQQYECQSIRKCQALDRITMYLHFYQTMIIEGSDDTDGLLLNYFDENKSILNDYGHVLQHLMNCNRLESNARFQTINDTLRKYVACDIEHCEQYQRNVRDRMGVQLAQQRDTHVLLYMDLLDTIHCTFVHCYDMGQRINTKQIAFTKTKQDVDEENDEEMNYLHALLKLKRKTLNNVSDRAQARNHKFTTILDAKHANFKLKQSMSSLHVHSDHGHEAVMLSSDDEEHAKCIITSFADEYVRGETIGESGTFGITFECWRKEDVYKKAVYAVKLISKAKFYQIEHDARVDLIQNMKKEIEVMKLLKHQNIVQLHQVYEDRNFLYLVMDYCKGGELFQRIADSDSLTEKHAANITKQILKALAYMQSHNICHFDLKPDNIMFDSESPNATVKLIDFGMSQIVPRLKKLNVCVGTPYYTAPEVLDGKYDRAADVWSVGVILFCMLFGYPPFYIDADALNNFGKKEEEEIFELIRQGFVAEVRPGYGPWFPQDIAVSQEAMDMIGGMLEYHIADRLTVHECLEHAWIRGTHHAETHVLPKTVISSLSNFTGTCKFKLLVSKLFAKKIEPSTYAKTLEVFKKWDVDGDGEITLEEFKKGMKETTDLSEQQIEAIFANLDSDDSRTITIDELVISAAFNALVSVDERLHQAFSELDVDGDGIIELKELKQVIESLHETKQMENIDEIIAEVDVNGDGRIDYEEFLYALHPHYNAQLNKNQSAAMSEDADIALKYQFSDTCIDDVISKKKTDTNMDDVVMPLHVNANAMQIKTNKKKKDVHSTPLVSINDDLTIMQDIDDMKEEMQSALLSEQSFGLRFNYMDVKDAWFVKPKYENLKQEIVGDLDLMHYQYALLKADYYLECEIVKNIESQMDYYHIVKEESIISLEHILAVVLYTDYDSLHLRLRRIFHRVSAGESDEALKKRHACYYHFCRLLYEAVNVFGEALNCNVYHCVDNARFTAFEVSMHGIVSCSTHLEVAINCIADTDILRDDGMVLELKANTATTTSAVNVRHFNCTFFSAHGNENERLLFGAREPIQIASIRAVQHEDNWKNYAKYVEAIEVYDNAVNGRSMYREHAVEQAVYEALIKLLEHELELQSKRDSNMNRNWNYQLPLFLSTYFRGFCDDKTRIVIDVQYMEDFYVAFTSYLVSSINKSLLSINEIVKLHANCTEIVSTKDANRGAIFISIEYLSELLAILRLPEARKCNLKVIQIINANIICEDDELLAFSTKFKQLQWQISYTKNAENVPVLSLHRM